jgi:hypothetical protein
VKFDESKLAYSGSGMWKYARPGADSFWGTGPFMYDFCSINEELSAKHSF